MHFTRLGYNASNNPLMFLLNCDLEHSIASLICVKIISRSDSFTNNSIVKNHYLKLEIFSVPMKISYFVLFFRHYERIGNPDSTRVNPEFIMLYPFMRARVYLTLE